MHMELIERKYTEIFIRSLIECIEIDPMSWRGWQCLHMDVISQHKGNIDASMADLYTSSLLVDIYLDDAEGRSIFYGNEDLFILCKNVLPSTLEDAAQHLSELFVEKFGDSPQINIYDLYHEGWSFCENVLRKIDIHHDEPTDNYSPIYLTNPYQFIEPVKRHKPLVMIVEDDPVSAQLAFNVIKDHCDVRVRVSMNEAIQEYKANTPDLIFLDIGLPDGDGRQILDIINKNSDKQSNVVMFSGNDAVENILETMQHGAKGFISKPFNKDKLLHYVRAI